MVWFTRSESEVTKSRVKTHLAIVEISSYSNWNCGKGVDQNEDGTCQNLIIESLTSVIPLASTHSVIEYMLHTS